MSPDNDPLAARAPRVRPRVHACLECGGAAPGKGDFCAATCRYEYNNRRKARGAELYDLYMAHRFDRQTAKELGVLQAMNRMASNWRQEDHQARASRRSWRRPADVLAERVYLIAKSVRDYTGRGRR